MDMARSEVRKLATRTTRPESTSSTPPSRRVSALPGFPDRGCGRASLRDESYKEVFEYIENRDPRQAGESPSAAPAPSMLGAPSATRTSAGASTRHELPGTTSTGTTSSAAPTPRHRHDLEMDGRYGRRLFRLLSRPDAVPRAASAGRGRSAMCRAYNRVALRAHSCVEPRIISMLYLRSTIPRPPTRPSRISATRRAWSLHGDLARYKPVHDNATSRPTRCWRRCESRSPSTPPTTGTTSRWR